ncbi:MAG TPA: 4Fe-4S binding protein [Spirochaetia bacterium]|nr:4Fe-4S binding protein [Spirochaetia bacterium]
MRRQRAPAVLLAAILVPAVMALCAAAASAQDRVPRPEFSSGYQEPGVTTPPPRAEWLQYLDVAALGAGLCAAGWLGLRGRSRAGIFLLGAASIAYFGFFRKGCICPIGAIQNASLALADPGYALPFAAVVFLALPLAAALVGGRAFCSGVCPFGALQDAVIIHPLRLPRWLTRALGFLPVIYLALSVLFAAEGAGFVICRFDPFISFFRLGGTPSMLALGAAFLVLGTVVARPYCRFLCPYGAILGALSRLSYRHPTISPDSCVQCGLCEGACPVDAIRAPEHPPSAPPSRKERRAFAAAAAALPLAVMLGAFTGLLAAPYLAAAHPTVRLAIQVQREDSGLTRQTTLESETFRGTRTSAQDLQASAARVRSGFAFGTPIAGGFLGLVLGLKVLATFVRPRRTEYQMDRAACVGCGRCYSYCPRERLRLRESRPLRGPWQGGRG